MYINISVCIIYLLDGVKGIVDFPMSWSFLALIMRRDTSDLLVVGSSCSGLVCLVSSGGSERGRETGGEREGGVERLCACVCVCVCVEIHDEIYS